MRTPLLIILAFALTLHIVLLPLPIAAEAAKPKRLAFFGRVESVDSERNIVTVKHGKVAGYMDSAATDLSVDEAAESSPLFRAAKSATNTALAPEV